MEFVLLALLFLCAVFLIVSVTIQKGSDEGLSGTIAGGSETYYGKDKSMRTGRLLNKWTLIVAVIFAVAVVVVYVIQPDYSVVKDNLDNWKSASEYSSIFK